MPCFFPLQATYSLRLDGKKKIQFSKIDYNSGQNKPDNFLMLPCGRCMGCRLERSRQWAVRCFHEAKSHSENCFITLTFSPEGLLENAPTGSICRKHVQDFMKRLRERYPDKRIRCFYCGEYGEQLGRPHYHVCLFGHDFADKEKFFQLGKFWTYISKELTSLWEFGNSTVQDFTFETAAYTARYVTKKITGEMSDSHYLKPNPFTGEMVSVSPEFVGMSNRPGLGALWVEKFGFTDLFPQDNLVIKGKLCKPPRYYDKLRERVDPEGFAKAKEARRVLGESKAADNTSDRLATKLKCLEARFRLLIRRLEK